jgi:acyl dehydratase
MSFVDSVPAATQQPAPQPAPIAVGDSCRRMLSFTPASIAEFARLTGDANPLHLNAQAAARSHHGRIIASGQQTTSQMIGLAATDFLRAGASELLLLNFNFALKSPVFADAAVELAWVVNAVEWHSRLQGWLVHADGKARSQGELCVVARGTLLIKV